METTVRNVRDINSSERLVLEHVLGQQLEENQQLIIQVVEMQPTSQCNDGATNLLPDWCNVYAGLTDDQIAEVEEVILRRADLTRVSE
jgi:hypothetical protein